MKDILHNLAFVLQTLLIVGVYSIAFLFFFATPIYAAIPTNGLVAKYDFSGNAVNSLSGINIGSNGTVFNAALTVDRFDNTDSAYAFNGSSSYIEFPDVDVFSIPTTGSLSISVWVRPDGTSLDKYGNLLFDHKEETGYVHWMGKGTPKQNEWTYRIYSADNADCPYRFNRMSSYVFNLAGKKGAGSYIEDKIILGKWLHFVSVVDTSTKKITWYEHGKQRDQDSFSSTSSFPVTPANGTAPVRIGTRDFDSYFAGAIDDIRIYNRVLSEAEVKELYMETSPKIR